MTKKKDCIGFDDLIVICNGVLFLEVVKKICSGKLSNNKVAAFDWLPKLTTINKKWHKPFLKGQVS